MRYAKGRQSRETMRRLAATRLAQNAAWDGKAPLKCGCIGDVFCQGLQRVRCQYQAGAFAKPFAGRTRILVCYSLAKKGPMRLRGWVSN